MYPGNFFISLPRCFGKKRIIEWWLNQITPFVPSKIVPIGANGAFSRWNSRSYFAITGGRLRYSRFAGWPFRPMCALSNGMPSRRPSYQCRVTGGRSPRAGNRYSSVSRHAHAPGQANCTSCVSTESGCTLPRSSAQNAASMMCVAMLPIDPLP